MITNHPISDYVRFEKLGEGTYGVVYKARHMLTNKTVALKRIKLEGEEGLHCTTLREIALLRNFHHPNIIILEKVLLTKKKLYMVFEFMDMDLQTYMLRLEKSLEEEQIRNIMYQILQGLLHCHKRRVIHRDLKPQNLLINEAGTLVKVADFGLGRIYGIPSQKMTTEIITQWYRAPEIILGTKTYNCSVDMWSVGCIFAELALGEPLFNGDSEIGQLFKIFQIIGTPHDNSLFKRLDKWQDVFPFWSGITLAVKMHGYMPKIGIDLLSKLLKYNPLSRLNSQETLLHEYFCTFDRKMAPASGEENEEYEKNFNTFEDEIWPSIF